MVYMIVVIQGSMMLRTRCIQCESSWERQEAFHDISVPVRIENADSDNEEGQYNKEINSETF